MLANNFNFLKLLQLNNNREWFTENKKKYEETQQELIVFAEAMLKKINEVDLTVGDHQPKQCLFRIYRDVRFSKDKSPYKTGRGVVLQRGGRKSPFAGYYIHIEPGKSFVGAGIYHPQKNVLDAVRKKIYFEHQSFLDIIESEGLMTSFDGLSDDDEKLKKIPKGFDVGHPAEEFLKHKNYLSGKHFPEDYFLQDTAVDDIAALFEGAVPLVHFINEAIEESME